MKRLLLISILISTTFLFCQEEYEIEVLGKRIPFTYDTKRNVLIVKGEFLKNLPCLNLPQLLSFIANMNFVMRGNFQADPQMMGFNQEQVLVMVNGIPMNNAQTGHHNFSFPFDVEQIERIEILRGGETFLWYFSGAGGAINIITSDQKSFKISRSSFNTTLSNLDFSSKHFHFSSGIVSTDGYMHGLDGKKYFLRSGVKFPIRGSSFDIWGGWVLSKFGAFNFYAPFPSFEELERFLGALNWRASLGSNIYFTLKCSSQFSVDEYILYRDDPDSYSNDHKAIQNTVDMGMKKISKKGTYYLGVSSYFDSIDSRGVRQGRETSALGNHCRRLYSLFGRMTWENGRVFMDSAARWTSGTYSHLSGRALFGFHIKRQLSISSSISRTFRMPTYTELYYRDPMHVSSENLESEITRGYNISLDYQTDKTESGARIFFNETKNLIDWRREAWQNIWVSENLKKGRYYGLDLSLSHSWEKILFRILYTLQKAEFEEKASIKSLKYHYYFPEHSLSLAANLSLKFISAGLVCKWEREKHTKKNRVYLNIKVEKKLDKISLFFEALNLFNIRVEKTPGLPEAPRSYCLGLNFNF